MRSVIAHILLFTITVHLFYSSGFLLDYYVNSTSYKANCENVDRPELNCDGKCILALKLRAANESEEGTYAPIPHNFEFVEFKAVVHILEAKCEKPKAIPNSKAYGYLTLIDCFHPPRMS